MLQVHFIKSSQLATFRIEQHHEVVIVMPAIEMKLASKTADVMNRRTEQSGVLVIAEDDARYGYIMTANLIYSKTTSDFFAYVAQDSFPSYYWLDYALVSLKKAGCGLLAFSDGRFFGKIAAFGLAKRSWVRSLYKNLIFYPEYKSHFADTELSVIANSTSNSIFNPNAILLEVDYEKHLHANNKDDEELYFRRAQTGFDGRIPPFIPEYS